jgi:glycosyltransferase involved in cell wall biosynthesis
MRILIATVQVPFIRGGAEIHAEGLRDALRDAGHEAEILAIQFKWYQPEKIIEHILACRLLDVSEVAGTRVYRLIGLRFPAYLIPHPNKVLWILHQHRTAYELWDHALSDLVYYPNGSQVRDAIEHADRTLIPEARAVFANSHNVAQRLKRFCDIDSTPLYHPPPQAEKFYSSDAEDYLFFPSRLCIPKRQELALEALAATRNPVRLVFAGTSDHPDYTDKLQSLAKKLKVQKRVEWLGGIDEDEKRSRYARALAVVYPPVDEDYGYVTLEAMLASKPVITCRDSGGPLEFVIDRTTGLITDPTTEALAGAFDLVWENRQQAKAWGEAGRNRYGSLNLSWSNVIEKLLA